VTRRAATRVGGHATLQGLIASCSDSASCAWLADVPIDDPDVPTPCLLLKLRGGAGRCACIDVDPTDDDSGILLRYEIGLTGWLGVLGQAADGSPTARTMAETCCGCGSALFQITDPGGLTAALTIGGDHVSCMGSGGSSGGSGSGGGGGAVFTIALRLEGCGIDPVTGRQWASFWGKGQDACLGDDTQLAPCDNTFHVRVECHVDCPGCGCTCPGCDGGAAIAWRAGGITGFTDGAFNGDWVWAADPAVPCRYVATCKETTSTLVFSSVTGKWTLSHGGVTYVNGVIGPCTVDKVFTTADDSGDAPSTITLTPIECPFSLPVGSSAMSTMTVTTSTNFCGGGWDAVPMNSISQCMVEKSSGGGGTIPGCTPDPEKDLCLGIGVVVQGNPDGTFNVLPWDSTTFPGQPARYAGPGAIKNVPNLATPPQILFSVTFPCPTADCTDCGGDITMTFKNF
jgi:hypothetical protein